MRQIDDNRIIALDVGVGIGDAVGQMDDNRIIVLDTNILNHIFTKQIKDGKAVLSLLRKYKKNLWIPYTVLCEFQQNDFKILKSNKLKEFKNFSVSICNEYDGFIQKLNKLGNNSNSKGFFEWSMYISRILENIDEKVKKEKEEIKKIKIQEYEEYEKRLNELIDDVNKLFDELCENGQIGKKFSVLETIDICKEGSTRFEAKIPPGYSDKGKKEGYVNYNDLFIWKEIINLAASYEKNSIIFLTDDMKEGNWWVNTKDEKKRTMSPILRQEFFECCPGNYEEKLFVDISFQTLEDFMKKEDIYDFSLIRMNKIEILEKIKQIYTDYIQDYLYQYMFSIAPISIEEIFFYPNNSGEILLDGDLVFESDNIEELEGKFCCKMTVSQLFEYYAAYEDNEGDIFNLGDTFIKVKAIVTITNKDQDYCAEKVLLLTKEDCNCAIEYVNYEIESCRTIYD